MPIPTAHRLHSSLSALLTSFFSFQSSLEAISINFRVREKHQSERETSTGYLLCEPWSEIESATLVGTLTGDRTCSLLAYGTRLQPTEPSGQGCWPLLMHSSACASLRVFACAVSSCWMALQSQLRSYFPRSSIPWLSQLPTASPEVPSAPRNFPLENMITLVCTIMWLVSVSLTKQWALRRWKLGLLLLTPSVSASTWNTRCVLNGQRNK